MPIDPNIAMGVKPIQLADPLAQYGRIAAIQNAQQQNQLAQMQMQEYGRARQEEQDIRNRLAGGASLDSPETVNFLMGSKSGRDILKSFRESQKLQADAKTAESALLDAKLKQARQFLENINPADPNAPQLYMQWHEANHRDRVLGPALAARGITAEQSRAKIEAAIAAGPAAFTQMLQQSMLGIDKFTELNKPVTEKFDLGGAQVGVSRPGLQPANYYMQKVPLPTAVEEQKGRIARAGAPTITVSTGKKYGETVAAGGAETDLAVYEAAQAAPNQIAKLDETLNILRTKDINTGIGAELFTVLDQARAQFLADKKAGMRVTSTQYLDSLLGSDVFPQISALGIGARGLDTPAERAFLRQVMTGTITLNKDTLIKMAELRRKGIESNVTKFNDLVDRGALDDFFAARRRPKEKVTITSAPKTEAPSLAEQIPTGRSPAAAPAAAPIYARNPATNERIMSTDGGNTWQPAR
jgi:hypothetical protein